MNAAPTPPPALSGARVLVSGASGYLASRLLPLLRAAGAEVLAQTRHPAGMDAAELTLLAGGMDEAGVQEKVRAFAPQYVYGLAGRTDPRDTPENRAAMEAEHHRAAVRLAELCTGPALEQLVWTGSCQEYGDTAVPMDEEQTCAPKDPYAAAKLAGTTFLMRHAAARGLPAVVVRPFVCYGPELARGVIHIVLQEALADRAFDTTAGTQTRDFVWADDVAEGLLLAAVAPAARGQVINLGTGVETPVRELVEQLCALAGGGRPNFGARPLGEWEVLRSVAATQRARTLLGWEARVPLAEGLRRVVAAAREAAQA